MPVIARRQTRARIIRHARRPRPDVRHGRQVIGGRVRRRQSPEHLGVPSAHLGQPLPAHAPAVIRAGHDVFPARLVAAVAVVVAGEKIARIVKSQFLRIAQTNGDDLQRRAVGIAAKHRAAVRQRLHCQPRPVVDDFAPKIRGGAAISDGEINSPVRPPDQPVQIVAAEGDVNAEAVEEIYDLGFTIGEVRVDRNRIGGGQAARHS